jgi:hypothetical protein
VLSKYCFCSRLGAICHLSVLIVLGAVFCAMLSIV